MTAWRGEPCSISAPGRRNRHVWRIPLAGVAQAREAHDWGPPRRRTAAGTLHGRWRWSRAGRGARALRTPLGRARVARCSGVRARRLIGKAGSPGLALGPIGRTIATVSSLTNSTALVTKQGSGRRVAHGSSPAVGVKFAPGYRPKKSASPMWAGSGLHPRFRRPIIVD